MTTHLSNLTMRAVAIGATLFWLTAGSAVAQVPAAVPPATVTQSNAAAQPAVAAATTPAAPSVKTVLVKAGSSGATVTFSDPKCTKFTLTGTAPNQTITCQ